MGVAQRPTYGVGEKLRQRWISYPGLLALFVCLVVFGYDRDGWTLQRHELTPQEATGVQPQDQHEGSEVHGSQSSQGTSSAPPVSPQPGDHGTGSKGALPETAHGMPQKQKTEHGQATVPNMDKGTAHGGAELSESGAHKEGHGGHGPQLPTLSPIPGVTFVETMIKLMDYELNGRFFGWRPNDIVIGRFTDNVNNYQLGVLEALRFTTLRLKDSLTRMGDADSYDPDLEQALNLFMNSAYSFWFPSAENSYGQALDHLRAFLEKLRAGQRSFYYRKDNLIVLIASYKDLLGNINKSLVRADVGWFKCDDYFYYAKGVAHVYYEILRVVRVGYQSQLASTMNTQEFMDEIIHELYRVEEMDPLLILNSDYNSLLANHRADLNSPLSEVAHLLGVLSQL